MTWDEHKHKRFKGRFVSMGLNMQSLRDKHNVHVDAGGNVTHKLPGGQHRDIGHVFTRADHKGHGASVNVEGGGQINERTVSAHPFASKAEAVAAVASMHPSVKSLNLHKDVGKELKTGQVVSVSGWGLARVKSVDGKGVIIRRVVSGLGGKGSRVETKRVTAFEVTPYNGSLEQWNGDPDKHDKHEKAASAPAYGRGWSDGDIADMVGDLNRGTPSHDWLDRFAGLSTEGDIMKLTPKQLTNLDRAVERHDYRDSTLSSRIYASMKARRMVR
jgi:hypothetical protein